MAEAAATNRPWSGRGEAEATKALSSPVLDAAGFAHAFFTRAGGVSPPPFDTLNFTAMTGDSLENVRENIARAADRLGVLEARVFFLSQVHGVDALRVDTPDVVAGRVDRQAFARQQGDATFALAPGYACGVRSADCGTILVGDRVSGAALAIHAGWQGTERGVVATALRTYLAELGEEASLVAAIGPHIEACCFEVDEDVAARLASASSIGERAIARRVGPKSFVDLRAILTAQLAAAGVASERIDQVRGCTKCDPDRYFSYRRDGKVGGRLLSAIVSRGTS